MNSLPISIHRNEYVHIVQEGETWKIEEKKLTFFEKVRVFFGFGEEYKQYQLGTVESMLANHIDVLKGDEHYAELVHKIHVEAGKSALPVIKTAHDNIEVNLLLGLATESMDLDIRKERIRLAQDGRLQLGEAVLDDWKPLAQREGFRDAYLEYIGRAWEALHKGEGRVATPEVLGKIAKSISDTDWTRPKALQEIAQVVSGNLNVSAPMAHHQFSAIEGGESRAPIEKIRFTDAAQEAWAKELASGGGASFADYMFKFWLHRQERQGKPIEQGEQGKIRERFDARLLNLEVLDESPDALAEVYNKILDELSEIQL